LSRDRARSIALGSPTCKTGPGHTFVRARPSPMTDSLCFFRARHFFSIRPKKLDAQYLRGMSAWGNPFFSIGQGKERPAPFQHTPDPSAFFCVTVFVPTHLRHIVLCFLLFPLIDVKPKAKEPHPTHYQKHAPQKKRPKLNNISLHYATPFLLDFFMCGVA
jgi:hypothetical protein